MTINPGKAALFALLLFVGSYAAGYFAPHKGAVVSQQEQPAPQDVLAPVSPWAGIEPSKGNETVTALSLLEDSRCPMNARCIWAGTVRVSAQVTVEGKQEIVELKLGEPKVVLGKTVTLTSVGPEKMAGEEYPFESYAFTFEVR